MEEKNKMKNITLEGIREEEKERYYCAIDSYSVKEIDKTIKHFGAMEYKIRHTKELAQSE